MSDSPYENTRSRKMDEESNSTSNSSTPTSISVDLKNETFVKFRNLQAIMKEGKRAKAKREQEMEEDFNSLAISPSIKSPKEVRIPKLNYDIAKPSESGKHVGLVFDSRMMQHKASKTLDYRRKHPERPERISRPLERLCGAAILDRVYLIPGREATKDELLLVHQGDHVDDIASTANIESVEDFEEKQERYNSIYLCKESYMCALVSCGCTLAIVDEVVKGSLTSGFALVRPPGHHAETHTAYGFCLFNNVAVAARHAQKLAKNERLVESEEMYKVLILDWDVHHGNGTQNMFYDDPSVLYISFHRYDNGIFFPSTEDANYDRVGNGKGLGFNINIPWGGARMGNSEYYTAFERIVMPIAEEFKPNLVLVSSGFDSGKGDPLGGYHVTPNMFGYMSHRLQMLAGGKVVIVLEGGYNLTTVSDSVLACVESLLEFPRDTRKIGSPDIENLKYNVPPRLKPPNTPGLSCILQVLEYIVSFWPCLESHKNKVDELLQVAKRLSIEKLTKSINKLEVEEDKNSKKRHSYGTRLQSSKKNENGPDTPNLNSSSSTIKSPENLTFSTPTGDSTDFNIKSNNETTENSNAFIMDDLKNALPDTGTDNADNLSDDSYYSTTSVLGGGQSPNTPSATPHTEDKENPSSAKMDGSYLDSLSEVKKVYNEPNIDNELGAVGGEIEITTDNKTRKEITMVLSAMGLTDIDGMSMEDMIAIAQATLPEHASGYTVPKDNCPHVEGHVNPKTVDLLNLDTFCAMCEYVIENWTCLQCAEVFCGRFVNAHMLDHFNETGHAVVLSHSDLSFWCYNCDAYLNNYTIKILREVYRKAHVLKHNVDLPS
ncbi:protein deacetylase HDAC6-like [Styela clava]